MKAEAYNALACLNRSFDVVLECMSILQREGVLSEDFVQDQTIATEELRAVINFMIVQKFTRRESEDCDHFGKMRENIEKERRGEQTASNPPSESGKA